MTNDLKNFLEGEETRIKTIIETYQKDLVPFSHFLFTEMIKDHDTRLINFVLSLVEKEVEKERLKPEHKGSYEVTVCGITNEMCDKISTILNNLRV